VQPLLDSRAGKPLHQLKSCGPPLNVDIAVDVAREALTAASERDIQTGDYIEIASISKGNKPVIQRHELKFD
jgi:20S proteasome alpha/beta subunit